MAVVCADLGITTGKGHSLRRSRSPTRSASGSPGDPPATSALEDPDPLHGIAQLVARWGAAFVLDPDGVTRTKALGSERMARKLRDALPGGEQPLRAAVWAFMRPILSPRLAELNKDAFVFDGGVESTVDLDAHRADSDLDDLDLGDDEHAAAA
ncbi:MAG: hypothetical protein ACRDPC_16520 [Solirubrobacteraceae bacterium]